MSPKTRAGFKVLIEWAIAIASVAAIALAILWLMYAICLDTFTR